MWYKLPSDNSTLNRSDAPPLPQHGFSLHDWHQQHFPTGLSWLSHEQWAAAILAVITHRHEDALLLPCAAARQCQSAARGAGTFIYLHPQVCNSTYSHSQYRNAFKSNRKMYIDDNRQITVPFAFFFFCALSFIIFLFFNRWLPKAHVRKALFNQKKRWHENADERLQVVKQSDLQRRHYWNTHSFKEMRTADSTDRV